MDERPKAPFRIFGDDSIVSVAGIWRQGSPDECRSYSIRTTSVNEVMPEIHDRMKEQGCKETLAEWLIQRYQDVDARQGPKNNTSVFWNQLTTMQVLFRD
jgi:putative SOS response-associated peptidase YedK